MTTDGIVTATAIAIVEDVEMAPETVVVVAAQVDTETTTGIETRIVAGTARSRETDETEMMDTTEGATDETAALTGTGAAQERDLLLDVGNGVEMVDRGAMIRQVEAEEKTRPTRLHRGVRQTML